MMDNLWTISIQIGTQQPYEVTLNKQVTTLGRNETADIWLPSNLVSRNGPHAQFILNGNRIIYEDLGGINGSIINGIRLPYKKTDGKTISAVEVQSGEIIDIDSMDRGSQPYGIRICVKRGESAEYDQIPLNPQGETIIGRSRSAQIQLADLKVSRQHAKIRYTNGKYELSCLSAANGVFLNHHLMTGTTVLTPRDVIGIGSTEFIFSPGCLFKRRVAVSKGDVVLKVRGVTRTEKGKLNGISLDVHKGELIAIIGGSGAGKSTLLNAISGSVRPESGTVQYNGQDLYLYHDALKKDIGFVPQKDIMHKNLKLKEMLDYAAKLRLQEDTSPAERENRVNRVMKELEIEGAANTSLMRVSGGQLKRASIGIEMLGDPELFFLDEPTSGLDPGTERHLMNTLREMTYRGKTIVLVTHTTQTLSVCDRIIVMGRGGNLCYYGAPERAKSFFGVEDYVGIFDKISDEKTAMLWHKRWEDQNPIINEPQKAAKQNSAKTRKASFFGHFAALTSRYVKLISNEPGWLLGMLLCIPVLTLFVRFVSDGNLFKIYSETYKALFTLICIPVFVGLLTSNGEICKERDVLFREYSANLRISSYLCSKLVTLLLLNAVQSVLLLLSFCTIVQVPTHSILFSPVIEMFLTLFFTMFSSTCLGLAVSAISPSRNVATSLLSILLIPQVVFSGAVFELEGVTRKIATVIHAFWGTNALAISAEMRNEAMQEIVVTNAANETMKLTPKTPALDYLQIGKTELLSNWRALFILAIACTVICYIALKLTANKYKE